MVGLIFLLAARVAPADEKVPAPHPPTEQSRIVTLSEGLALPAVGRQGRTPIHQDALAAEMVAGTWTRPKVGAVIKLPGGETRKWQTIKADKGGNFSGSALAGGYVYFAVPSVRDQVMILEAAGHSTVYVNGEPRAGDPYSHGYLHLPVLLKAGTNDFLFHVGRGKLRARLAPPKAHAYLDLSDTTTPDLIAGEINRTWAGIVVVNATQNTLHDLYMQASCVDKAEATTKLYPIAPLSIRKVGVYLEAPPPQKEGSCRLQLKLFFANQDGTQQLDSGSLNLGVRLPQQTHKNTFVSNMDDSIQYYSLVPARLPAPEKGGKPAPKPGLALTLHGAAVEASGQATCFAPKPWVHVVAPTNRRPFGFDWEDWGRLDAMEVLDLTQRQLATDPHKTYVTGHSMGGHGTWHLGVTYPDRFAAIGPSAAWISMWSYAGAWRPANPDPVQEMLLRPVSASDTLALAQNFKQEGIYILHGERDDNVPVEQSRTMVKRLADFHRDFVYHEQAGAAHWWGNPCVDWPPMFEFFSWHTLPQPSAVRKVDFTTASSGVSACCHWACIEAQIHPSQMSSVHLNHDPGKRTFSGSTENVARLAFDVAHLQAGQPIEVELDGQKLGAFLWPASDRVLWFERRADTWAGVPKPSLALKRPERYGPFKEAFRNRMQLIYGTKGTPDENAWALSRARYDAETFYYRGNGSVDVLPDTGFQPTAEPNRNVILYGNADTNGAWSYLLADSPVQIRRGIVRLGDREESGDDLACLFVRPRPGGTRALVGVVAGTGFPGLRMTEHLPYFSSGVGYPDCVLVGADSLLKGTAAVRAAGFFGNDWSVPSGDFVWQKQPAPAASGPRQ
jgi:pimeloyl-ACP methyl ester carboxylesterase